MWVIPEDKANRQLINGFVLHDAVADRNVKVRKPPGGWSKVLQVFESEYLPKLRSNKSAHVVLLIDFDGVDSRRAKFDKRISDDVKSRVFVVGSKVDPETLKKELKGTLEGIGQSLAEDCLKDDFEKWNHSHLVHNHKELLRLVISVKPILFQPA